MSQATPLEKLDKNFAPLEVADGLHWYDVQDLGIEGRGWSDTQEYYHRLPARAKGVVRDGVWELGQNTAGLCVRFVTASPTISARWKLRNENLAMPHMPATGVSGLDLYAKLDGQWLWAGVGIPNGAQSSAVLTQDFTRTKREYMLYLPLYNGVESLAIGLPPDAKLARAPRRPARRQKGIVVYGTSITQGGCACRAGMGYVEILARSLDCQAVNLGFSGNGPMEPEVVRFMAELDPAVFVLDCLPNMNAQQVRERTEVVVNLLRQARPWTPIVLVENIIYQQAPFRMPGANGHEEKNFQLRSAYQRLLKAKVKGLHYVGCRKLLGDDGLGTVDRVHPTDVGFLRIAKALEPVLRKLI